MISRNFMVTYPHASACHRDYADFKDVDMVIDAGPSLRTLAWHGLENHWDRYGDLLGFHGDFMGISWDFVGIFFGDLLVGLVADSHVVTIDLFRDHSKLTPRQKNHGVLDKSQLGFAEDDCLFSPWEIHYLGNL
jgi:hypothetical protein